MALNLGAIYSTLELRMDRLESDVAKAKGTLGGLDRSMDNSSSIASNLGAAAGKVLKAGLVAGTAAAAGLTAGLTKASKASWNQVDAVEQATVGLRAYERDGAKVNAVLGDLISYARSDMGVLFNRKDLFQSAQMMKLNGAATENLSGNVQILSRSVGLGLGNWDLLNRSVGRVLSTGRLTGIEFDILTESGFKLDKSLRNTNLTAEELFDALDKGIPTDALEGQANTIRGLGIRMESAFRGVGDAVLQVDSDTSKFVEGGLGDRLVKGMGAFTGILKDAQPLIRDWGDRLLKTGDMIVKDFKPTIDLAVKGVSGFAREFTSQAVPAIQGLYRAIVNDLLPGIRTFISSPLVSFLGQTLTFAFKTAAGGATILTQGLGFLLTHFDRFVPTLAGVVVAIGLYRGAVIASNVVTTIKNGLHAAQVGLLTAQAAASMLASGMTVKATVAMLGLNAAMLANPIGLVIAALGGLVVALGLSAGSTDRTKSSTDLLNDARARAKTAADNLKLAEDALSGAQMSATGAALAVERAERTYEETKARSGAESLEAREAEHQLELAKDSLKTVNEQLEEAERKKKEETQKSKDATKIAEEAEANRRVGLENVRAELDRNRTHLGMLNTDLNNLNGRIFSYTVEQKSKDISVINDGVSSPAAKAAAADRYRAGARFMGGPVRRNQPYFVGENRDGSLNDTSELFVPGQSGRIISSKDLQSMLSGTAEAPTSMPARRTLTDSMFASNGSSGSEFDGATFNITMNGVEDPDGFTRELKLAFAGRGK